MSDTWRADFASAPSFAHLRAWSEALRGADWPATERLNRLADAREVANARGLPIRFVPQRQRCGQRDYEAGILATGEVPTREANWHDLLNALSWLAFPATKAALNALQCESLSPSSARGPESDAATLFDESGLVIAGPEGYLARSIANKSWREAFVERRDEWRRCGVFVVGHAVLEKLLAPWPGITAKCLFVRMDTRMDTELGHPEVDAAVAAIWREGVINRPAQLFPMPVLGIPGWWPANENPAFYDNKEVFRPARK